MTAQIGPLIIDLEGKTLSLEEQELLNHPLVGGVILFTRNYASRSQLKTLCQSIRFSRKTPLLIMVDQEGGRVQRFISEFTRLPNMGFLGEMYTKNQYKALEMSLDIGWLMASELLSVGIDLSLAPILDLNTGMSTVIGNRAFHADPQAVIELASAFARGMQQAGMAATGKHFPGHGSVESDSHVAIPYDRRCLEEIEQHDLVPFRGLIHAQISAIMAAHIIFPEVDALPVGYSRFWLQEVLRKKLNFSGIILSDDLSMEGANISTHYTDRVEAAIAAGCDFTLLCNHRQGVIEVLDHLSQQHYLVNNEKWSALQGDFSAIQKPLSENLKWQKIAAMLSNHAQTIT